MNYKVQGRKESLILREVTLILGKELNNPILKNVSIAEVQLANDGELAKIYYSFLSISESVNENSVANELERYNKKIRMILSRKIQARTVPELKFIYDTSLLNANRIDDILNGLK